MTINDEAFKELLELLKGSPDLIYSLVLKPNAIQQLLNNKDARGLVGGVDPTKFLSQNRSGIERHLRVQCDNGCKIANCLGGTRTDAPVPQT
jgi:hypothetical protein